MTLKISLLAGLFCLGICSCTTTADRQPAANPAHSGYLVKVCKSEASAKWELYNGPGIYRDEITAIHFFNSSGTGPHIINQSTKDFIYQRSILEAEIAAGRIQCVGVENIETHVIASLKSDLDNFLSSNCSEKNYLRSIDETIKNIANSSKASISEINKSDILIDTFKEFFAASLGSDKDLCREVIAKTKGKLNNLSSKDAAAAKDQKKLYPKVTK